MTVQISDDLANLMRASGDLPRRALEALAAEEYKRGRLTKPDLRRLPRFEIVHRIDEFLKEHECSRTTRWETWSASVRACSAWALTRLVVAGTSPLRYLVQIDRIDLLPRLFEKIFIPSVVCDELRHPSLRRCELDKIEARLA